MTTAETLNELLPFMKGVGVGKNNARDLDRDSADKAMTALLKGAFHPVTFGAFFMGLRYKGESPEELSGFLEAMYRTSMQCTMDPPEGLLNCAGAYDGKARTCNVSIPAALVAVGAGVPMGLHGAQNIPTKHGMTPGHILKGLGIAVSESLMEACDDLHSIGIAYASQEQFHPGLDALLDMRNQMGKRTILNTMETLSNPFRAKNHLGGFFHDPYAGLVCQTLAKGCSLFQRATLVKGIEGSDELRPGEMFIARYIDGQCVNETVNSDELELPVHISELSAPTDSVEHRVEFSVQKIKELLAEPRRESGYRNSVILNGAIRIYAAGKAESMPGAVLMARDSLDSGRAGEVLKVWLNRRGAML